MQLIVLLVNIGITHGKCAQVTMSDCTVERNGLAPGTKEEEIVSLGEPELIASSEILTCKC